MSTDRWLSRFAFSFFIIAGLLVWETYKSLSGQRGPVPQWRVTIYLVATILAIVMGVLGIRARHRLIRDIAPLDRGPHQRDS